MIIAEVMKPSTPFGDECTERTLYKPEPAHRRAGCATTGETATGNKDAVNHPTHYTGAQNGVECIDAIQAATENLSGVMAFCTGNAIKYLWRWSRKNGREDLEKSRWYIDRMISELPD